MCVAMLRVARVAMMADSLPNSARALATLKVPALHLLPRRLRKQGLVPSEVVSELGHRGADKALRRGRRTEQKEANVQLRAQWRATQIAWNATWAEVQLDLQIV